MLELGARTTNLPPGPTYTIWNPRFFPFVTSWLRDPSTAMLSVAQFHCYQSHRGRLSRIQTRGEPSTRGMNESDCAKRG